MSKTLSDGRRVRLLTVIDDEQPCPGRVSARPLDDQAVLGANDVEPADVAAADRVVDEDGTPVHERRLHGFAQDLDDAAVSGDEPEALSATGFRNLMRLGDALVVKEAPTARRGGQLGDADVVGVLVAARAYAPRLKGQSCVSMTVTTLEAIQSRLAASGLPQHAVVRSLGISQMHAEPAAERLPAGFLEAAAAALDLLEAVVEVVELTPRRPVVREADPTGDPLVEARPRPTRLGPRSTSRCYRR